MKERDRSEDLGYVGKWY